MDSAEKDFYSSFLIAVSVVGIILLYFLVSIIRQQRRYRKLAKAKINAEITTLENERKRIASDLHDEVGPLLSAVKLQINHIDAEDQQHRILVEKSSKYIDEVIKKMRDISNDLLPNILVRRGLVYAVEDFLEKLRAGTSTKIESDLQLSERLPMEIEVNVFRIIQEITHNMIKHSCAVRFRLELSLNPKGNLVLATADDGVGIAANIQNRKESGLGLLNLQSRAEMMGGEFAVDTAPGKGTRYLFEIPIKK